MQFDQVLVEADSARPDLQSHFDQSQADASAFV